MSTLKRDGESLLWLCSDCGHTGKLESMTHGIDCLFAFKRMVYERLLSLEDKVLEIQLERKG